MPRPFPYLKIWAGRLLTPPDFIRRKSFNKTIISTYTVTVNEISLCLGFGKSSAHRRDNLYKHSYYIEYNACDCQIYRRKLCLSVMVFLLTKSKTSSAIKPAIIKPIEIPKPICNPLYSFSKEYRVKQLVEYRITPISLS